MNLYFITSGMFIAALIFGIFYVRKFKRENQDIALKVDYFEDKINEAHEKLTNVISYQYTDVISKLDDIYDSLESSELISPASKYASVSNDELYKIVKIIVVDSKTASASFLQRKFDIGYARAALLLDMLEENKVVGPGQGAKPREVFLTRDDLTDDELLKLKEIHPNDDIDDDLYNDAKEVVMSAQKASASLLQRRLKVGYARAARLLDLLEENYIVGEADGAEPRDVLVDTEGKPYEQETESA